MPINGNTNQQYQVTPLGNTPGVPITTGVAGQAGYPASGQIKGATLPYWSYGSGVPTFTAPYGSLYTDTSADVNEPDMYIYVQTEGISGNVIGEWQAFEYTPSTLPGGALGQFDVTTYGALTKQAFITSQVAFVAAGSSFTVNVNKSVFQNGDFITVSDYAYCISGYVTSGGGTGNLTVTCSRIWSGAPGNAINVGSYSIAQGDDSVAIQAAFTAAINSSGQLTANPCVVYFPPGRYATTATINIPAGVSVWCENGAYMVPCGAAVTDCFLFSPNGEAGGQFTFPAYYFPSVLYFSLGAAFDFTPSGGIGPANNNWKVNTIRGCLYGIKIYDNYGGLFGIESNFNNILNCFYGIWLRTLNAQTQMQGMVFNGNFIGECYIHILFSCDAGTSTSAPFTAINPSTVHLNAAGFINGDYIAIWDGIHGFTCVVNSGGGTTTLGVLIENYFNGTTSASTVNAGAVVMAFADVPATIGTTISDCVFNIGGINGNYSSSTVLPPMFAAGQYGTYGIVAQGIWLSQHTFIHPGTFGAFAPDNFVQTVGFGGMITNCNFEAPIFYGANTAYDALSGFTCTVPNWPASNRILNTLGQTPVVTGGYIAATTSRNTRVSFNGGTPIWCNKIPLSLSITALGSLGTATFFAYSPLTTGDPGQCRFTITNNSGSGIIVSGCTDESTTTGVGGAPIANEIGISVVNIGSTFTGTVYGYLTIGI